MNQSPSWNKMSDRSHRFFLEKHKQAKRDVGQIWGNISIQLGQRERPRTRGVSRKNQKPIHSAAACVSGGLSGGVPAEQPNSWADRPPRPDVPTATPQLPVLSGPGRGVPVLPPAPSYLSLPGQAAGQGARALRAAVRGQGLHLAFAVATAAQSG